MDVKGELISITHFINPQLFWYHIVDVRSESHLRIEQLEKELTTKYQPPIADLKQKQNLNSGDLVIAWFLPRNKYLRARVFSTEDCTEYILWAIDHGFPFKANSQCIHKLSEDTWLRAPIDHIYRGGVANILPAEKDFDFMECKAIMTAKPKWCDRACTFLQKYIADAVYVSFDKHFEDDTRHIWGDLIFVDRKQKTFNVADLLKTLNVAIDCEKSFRHTCKTFSWTKIWPYVNNKGELNVRKNLYVTHSSSLMREDSNNTKAILQNEGEDASECKNAKQKVDDWHERNLRLLKSNNNGPASLSPSAKLSTEPEGKKFNNETVMSKDSNTVSSMPDFESSIGISHDAMFVLDDSRDFFYPHLRNNAPSICSKSSLEGAKSVHSLTSSVRSKRMQSLIDHKRKLELKGRDRKADDAKKVQMQDGVLVQADALGDNLEKMSLTSMETNEKKHQVPSALNNFYADYVQSSDEIKCDKDKIGQSNANYIDKLSSRDTSSVMSAKRIERLKATRKGFTATGDSTEELQQTSTNKFKDVINRNTKEINMIPAGYNLMNLNPRKDDVDNYDVTRKTISDSDCNESTDSFEKLLNSMNSSSKNELDVMKAKKYDSDASHVDNQNFRHTRSHTDKYKDCVNDDRHLLDISIPDLDNTVLEPIKVTESNTSKLASVVLPRRKQLKPPSEQKDKIQKILQNAELEKELGNATILDLKNSTVTECREADILILNSTLNSTTSTSTTTSTDSKSSRHKTSNKNALVMKRLTTSGKNSSNVSSTSSSSRNENESPVSPKINMTPIYIKESFQIDNADVTRQQFGGLGNKVLTHAGESVKLQLIEDFNDVHFPQQEITDQMNYMHITKVYRIQAYGWMHILRGNSLFVVNPARSGKTWCYLPSICSLVCLRMQNCRVADTYGPVAIIMVPSSTHAEQITRHCERLLTKCNINVATLFGVRNSAFTKMRLLNGCGILVTTPASLLRLLTEQDNFINGNRLHHFILDDVELMLSRSNRDFIAAVEAILNLSKRCKEHTLQLVTTSREWKPMLLPLIKNSCQPLLLIGDFLEAAVYSKTTITIKLSAFCKMLQISNFIKDHPSDINRLIIFCINHEEAVEIHDTLTSEQFDCIVCSRNSSDAGLQLVNRWKCWPRGLIVICVDDVFPEINVHNANNLIHYSMPESWTVFNNRFSAMAQSYENLVNTNASKIGNELKPVSLILLDENNSEQLPRLYDFLKKHNQLPKINPEVLKVIENVKRQREVARTNNKTTLCPYLLEFGDCDETRCLNRHTLNDNDVIKESENMLQSGELRLHILKVYTPTHYSARLLQHKPENTTAWNEVRKSSMASVFATGLNLHYQTPQSCVEQFPLAVNDICVCNVDGVYQRALVLETDNSKDSYLCVVTNIKVKLIDLGETKQICSNELFVCEERFKDFPAQAIDIRLKGVVPFDNERTWDSMSTKSVDKWIKRDIDKDMCVQVKINFAFAETIWVNNVIVLKHLSTVGHYTYHVNLRRSLFEKKLAVIASDDTLNIQSIAMKLDLLKAMNNSKEDIDVEEDWDNLSVKSTNEVYVPLIPTEPDKNFLDQKCPLNCTPPIPPSNNSIPLPNVAKLVKDQWIQLPIQDIVKVEIGDEAENGNWSDIYLQCIKDEQQSEFGKLRTLIEQHINNLKNVTNSISHNSDIAVLMQNCIVKYDGIYLRAKIVGIFGSDKSKSIYRFFLCDYACFVETMCGNLFNDFLYPTTKEIVECTPYQAVHCHLAGIKLDKLLRQQKVTKDYLFAYAVKEHTEVSIQNKLNIKTYDILLYESDDEHNLNSAVMLNKMLVNDGYAELDPDTKNYLELDLAKDLIKLDLNNDDSTVQKSPADDVKVVSFDALLQCFQKAYELDAEMQRDQHESDNENHSIEQGMKNEILDQDNTLNTIPDNEQTTDNKLLESRSPKVRTTVVEIESMNNEPHLPPLRTLYKRPQTTWYQTDCIIIVLIYAPDITDYYLKVTRDLLHFTACVNGEDQALLLHLLGTIEPSSVSHEVRGLNVIVRMLKCVYMKWPRLVKQSTKFSWLKYDLNTIDSTEMDYFRPQRELFRNIERKEHAVPYNYSDSDSDDEIEFFENYAPIINSDDIRDPTSDLY